MKRAVLTIVSAGMALLMTLTLCSCAGGDSAGADPTGTSTAVTSAITQPPTTTATQTTATNTTTKTTTTRAPRTTSASPTEAPVSTFTLTLYADFSGSGEPEEHILTHDISMPLENEPASPSLIAFALADGLTEWTGLNFKINDMTLDADSVTVDLSADSTLIAGFDGSEPNDGFIFTDDASLNWFMMDSLALTLKNNFDVATVYFNSAGGQVAFTNPDDMAEQGLPELPVDQSNDLSSMGRRVLYRLQRGYEPMRRHSCAGKRRLRVVPPYGAGRRP